MGAHKMIIGSPPVQVSQQMGSLLGRGPGAVCQCCHSMSDAQIDALDKSGVQSSREAHPQQGHFESRLSAEAHHMRDLHELAPSVAFFYLTID